MLTVADRVARVEGHAAGARERKVDGVIRSGAESRGKAADSSDGGAPEHGRPRRPDEIAQQPFAIEVAVVHGRKRCSTLCLTNIHWLASPDDAREVDATDQKRDTR